MRRKVWAIGLSAWIGLSLVACGSGEATATSKDEMGSASTEAESETTSTSSTEEIPQPEETPEPDLSDEEQLFQEVQNWLGTWREQVQTATEVRTDTEIDTVYRDGYAEHEVTSRMYQRDKQVMGYQQSGGYTLLVTDGESRETTLLHQDEEGYRQYLTVENGKVYTYTTYQDYDYETDQEIRGLVRFADPQNTEEQFAEQMQAAFDYSLEDHGVTLTDGATEQVDGKTCHVVIGKVAKSGAPRAPITEEDVIRQLDLESRTATFFEEEKAAYQKALTAYVQAYNAAVEEADEDTEIVVSPEEKSSLRLYFDEETHDLVQVKKDVTYAEERTAVQDAYVELCRTAMIFLDETIASFSKTQSITVRYAYGEGVCSDLALPRDVPTVTYEQYLHQEEVEPEVLQAMQKESEPEDGQDTQEDKE